MRAQASRMMQHLMVLDARSERQVVTLDTLCEYFPGQVYLARDFPGIASPLITGDNARQGASRFSNRRHVSSLRGPKV